MNLISAGIQPTKTKPFHIDKNFVLLIDVMVSCQKNVLLKMASNILEELRSDMLNDDHFPDEAKVIVNTYDEEKHFITGWESAEKCL